MVRYNSKYLISFLLHRDFRHTGTHVSRDGPFCGSRRPKLALHLVDAIDKHIGVHNVRE
jgi:hypothetical protein